MRGLSKNFNREKVPFKDGNLYYLPDKNEMWLDSEWVDESGTKQQTRNLINKPGSEPSYNEEECELVFK